MGLEEQFINGFKTQVNQLGLALTFENDVYIATGNELYLSLKIIQEQFGRSHLTFAVCTVIVGNYQKALAEADSQPTPNEATIELTNSSFMCSSANPAPDLATETLAQLEEFIALNTYLYSDPTYIFLQQKGTHDLIWKDPLLIQVLRGKQPFLRIIEQLKQLNLPYGKYIQKPKGMGKTEVIKRWKMVGKITLLLFIAWLLFKILVASN